MASVAAAVALAAGWALAPALALWAALAARLVPSILYVRALLARLHGKQAAPAAPLAAQVCGLAGVCALIACGLLPALAALPFAVLLARAAAGLFAPREGLTARRAGFAEIGYGALTVFAVAAGVLLGR